MRRRWVRRATISLLAVVTLSAVAVALLFWRLSQGPVSLDFMRERIQAEINKSLGGMSARLGGVIIERDSVTGIPHFRLRNLELLDAQGRTIARTPKAAVGVDGSALLNFQLLPKQIELIGPRILVRRTLGGSFELGFGPAPPPGGDSGVIGQPIEAGSRKSNRADQAPDFGGIVPATPGRTLVNFLSGALPGANTSGVAIASLDSVLVSNAAIQLYDEANAATWY
ncbi:MAG: hypothetical protein ACJ8AS_03380, partial [Hyphomicrobiales bacterium]